MIRACQTSRVSGSLISTLPTIQFRPSPSPNMRAVPYLVRRSIFHPLSWRVLGPQDTADKSLTGHKDLFIFSSINKVIIRQHLICKILMPAVRIQRLMSAVRCFVRTKKHSLNRDLAHRSSKPSITVLSFQFDRAHKAPTGILVYHPWSAPPRHPLPAILACSGL